MKFHFSNHHIDPIQWQQLIKRSGNASYFQTPECYEFYASLPFMKPFVCGVSENDILVGIMCGYIISDGNPIKQFFSKRAIIPGGLLLDHKISSAALSKLLDESVSELSGKAIYIEIRNYNDYSAFRPTFKSSGFDYKSHLNFHIATSDSKDAIQNFSSSKRRQIKLSLKAGAIIEEATTEVEVQQFYTLLTELYKKKIKLPLFPLVFFEKLFKLPNAKIIVIKFNKKVIGGIACVLLENKVVYEWFVCGEDGVLKNIYPSVLATYAGIEYAEKNGFERFDFMGAGKPDDGYGVREFKSKFGGELVEQGRFLYICKPMLYTLGKFIIKILRSKK